MKKKIIGTFLGISIIIATILPVTGRQNEFQFENLEDNGDYILGDYPLPPPISVDMVLEESICRRMSVRSFTTEEVTDEELSTILWAAYGYTENGSRTIYNHDETYSTIIYIIRSDATYKYDPENHSLSLYKNGNYLHLGQYNSPIKFGLVWDTDITSDEMRGMAEVGMIGQNIYFDANALDLGTVTTGMYVEDLYELGIPPNEKPAIIMPLGHPSSAYDFTYDPLPESNLPSILNNSNSLEDAINNRLIVSNWDNLPLSLFEQSQLIWSSYGYSYLYDNINNKRHRTLPSAIGIYPFKIFAANHSGVYQYSFNTHSITEKVQGDKREEIKDCLESNNITINSASWIIVPFLDTNVGGSQYQHFWYYEVGAITHNILLEASALELSANVIYNISDGNGLRSAMGISSQTNLVPLAVIPTGNTNLSNPPEIPNISGPINGEIGRVYFYSTSTNDPDDDQVFYMFDWGDGEVSGWIGPYSSGDDASAGHKWAAEGNYEIKVKAKDDHGAQSDWSDPIIIYIFKELLEVKLISGGLFKLKSTIKNNGFSEINKVNWDITLDGGFIPIGRKTTGIISNISEGEEINVDSNPIIGFGAIKVRVTIEATESSDIREQSGFIILLYVKVNPSG